MAVFPIRPLVPIYVSLHLHGLHLPATSPVTQNKRVISPHCTQSQWRKEVYQLLSESTQLWSTGGCFTILAELHKWVLSCCKFIDGTSMVIYQRCNLCQKLNDGSASFMWSRHIISDTNFSTAWLTLFHTWKRDTTKTNGSTSRVVKHITEYYAIGLIFSVLFIWGNIKIHL